MTSSVRRGRSRAMADFILEHVASHPRDIVRFAANYFKVSRQAVHRVLKELAHEGRITTSGKTRSAAYALGPIREHWKTLPVSPALAEHTVWTEAVLPHLADLPENVLHICEY